MTSPERAELTRRVERVRALLVGAALALVPWLIAPGRVQPDTKVDLTVSPWRYLARSLTAWNDHAGLGELQNQAYGYLFPMGPVLGAAQSLGLPGWAAQRLWWSLLVVTAFAGAHLLVRRLGLAGPVAALVAATAYALSPRVLTVLSEISAEAWPLAVAPWLVLAVLPATRAGAARRERWHAAALTGLLTAALGGVNATASAVVLLLPLGWLLASGAAGRRALLPWAGGVALGSAWWVLPLLVLGRYSYPFLDFIETSQITTAVTSTPNTLRGASHWVAYILDREDHPVWQAGWMQAQDPLAIVATSLVAGAGVAGLLLAVRARPATVRRAARWGLGCVVVATVLMAVGHPGRFGGPLAGSVQALLDGPLAPLRNVHKLDPVLRLPIALGVGHLLTRAGAAAASGRAASARPARAALALVLAGVVLSPMALWTGRGGDAMAYGEIPDSWRQTARDVDRLAARDGGATLLLPASRNAHYTWGSATDEPLSALATSPVVVRASAPLGHPGATRLLDAVDRMAASGVPQPALAPTLQRLGISRVVLRADLATSTGAPSAAAVRRTLAASPGFTPGPVHGRVSVWTLGPTPSVTAYDASAGRVVSGGPEAIPDLLAAGLLDPRSYADLRPGTSVPGAVHTDSLLWRAYSNGRTVAEAYGPVLPPDDPRPTQPGTRDLPPAGDPTQQPARAPDGAIRLPGTVDPARDRVLLDLAAQPGTRRIATRAAGEVRLQVRVALRPGAAVAQRLRAQTAPDGARVRLPCGAAGSVQVGSQRVPLALDAPAGLLRAGGPVAARACGTAAVPRGSVDIAAAAGDLVQPRLVELSPAAAPDVRPGPAPRAIDVTERGTGTRTVAVAAGGSTVLALTEGANAGWRATTADGRALDPVTVDGWRQGFRLPAGGATQVRIEFAPTRSHRAGLAVGAAAVLLLAALAWLTRAQGSSRRRAATTTSRMREADSDADPPRSFLGVSRGGRWRWLPVGAAVLAGWLVAGLAGVLLGLAATLLPERRRPHAALAGMGLAGVALAALGVVDERSAGAALGQLLGTLTLVVAALGWSGWTGRPGRSGWRGAPSAGSAAPPAEPTATPPRR